MEKIDWRQLVQETGEVVIPDSVTEIFDEAFLGCEKLTRIEIPDSVTKIGDSAFKGCTGLEWVGLPNSLVEIGASAFEGCEKLGSIEIPKSVTKIGRRAFASCADLTVCVYNPEIIDETVFDGGTNLKITKRSTIEHKGVVFMVDETNGEMELIKVVTDPVPSTLILPNKIRSIYEASVARICDVKSLAISPAMQSEIDLSLPHLFPNISEIIFNEDDCGTHMNATIRGSYDEYNLRKLDRIVFPSTLIDVNEITNLYIKKLVFNGHLPPMKEDAFKGCFVEKIYLNDPITEVDRIPEALVNILYNSIYVRCSNSEKIKKEMEEMSARDFKFKLRDEGRIIFGTPPFCKESELPGYIQATAFRIDGRLVEDKVVDINTSYITLVESVNDPVQLTRIHLVNRVDAFHLVDVFEPREMIIEQIKTTIGRIDANTLLAKLETLLKQK